MKIRNGFVSNSSSSSFVILGVKRNGEYEELDENIQNLNIQNLYVDEGDYDYITGIVISDGEEYLEFSNTAFSELSEMANNISTALNVDISEVELVTGCRPC